MTIQNIPLIKAMAAKMNYLEHRQQVLARNIANADTPNYQAHDLTKVDFGSMLKEVSGGRDLHLARTQPGHMVPGGDVQDAKDRKQKITYEVAPAGNAVILEEQMVKANETTMDFNLLTNLLRKEVGMIQTALGRSQG